MTLTVHAKPDTLGISMIAGADLSARLYRFGKYGAAGVVACSVAGEAAHLIIASKPDTAGLAVDGWTERKPIIECGGTVSAGDNLTTDSVGRAVTAVAGQVVNAIAMSDGVVGAFIPVFRPLALNTAGDGGYQAISASGAISPTAGRVDLSVDGTKAYTLADGVVGHEIDLFCVAGTNTPRGTVTIATVYGSQPTTHVFTNQGQRLKLRMTATGWAVVGKVRAGTFPVVVGTTVLTGVDLVAIYDLSVTGTVSSTTTKAIPDAQLDGEQIEVRCSTAASTPAGSIGFTGKSLAAAAHTSAGAIDATTDYFVARWNGSAFLELFTNGITFS